MAGRRAADLLREARSRSGLSQSELSRRAGIPQSVISAYERARRVPSVDTMERLAAAIGFEVVLRARPNPREAGRALRDVLSIVDRLPPTNRTSLEYPRLPS